MAVSILEALQNANINLQMNGSIGAMLAKEQLKNAVTLLEKGYSVDDEVEPLLDKYGSVDNVPEKRINLNL
jgi:hypothetical protein